MPELYGNKIAVVRSFTRSGASSYKLLSERGGTVSTRKADLDAICEHMGIQVDNPVSILTQGMSGNLCQQRIWADSPLAFRCREVRY